MAHSVRNVLGGAPLPRYRGGCQCGCVVFEARLDVQAAHARSPSVWERMVASGAFMLLRGEDLLRGYQFSDLGVHHFYCERCGTRAFSHHDHGGGEFYSVDLKSLHVASATELPPAARAAPPSSLC